MRTNIDLDDELLAAAMRHSTAHTTRALVEEALRTFVSVKTAELRRSSDKERLASIQTRTNALRLRKSAADIIRQDRSRS